MILSIFEFCRKMIPPYLSTNFLFNITIKNKKVVILFHFIFYEAMKRRYLLDYFRKLEDFFFFIRKITKTQRVQIIDLFFFF